MWWVAGPFPPGLRSLKSFPHYDLQEQFQLNRCYHQEFVEATVLFPLFAGQNSPPQLLLHPFQQPFFTLLLLLVDAMAGRGDAEPALCWSASVGSGVHTSTVWRLVERADAVDKPAEGSL